MCNGYYEEIMRVGVIDNDEMREYAFYQLAKGCSQFDKINPQTQLWNI